MTAETNKELKKAIVQANKDLKRTEYGGFLFIVYIVLTGIVLGILLYALVLEVHMHIAPFHKSIMHEIPKLLFFVIIGLIISTYIFSLFPFLFKITTIALIGLLGYVCFSYLYIWWAILVFIIGTLTLKGLHDDSVYTIEFKEEMEIQ